MRKSLDLQLAKYLRKQRGEMSYAQFAKKTGISHTMLHRLELRERHITLNKLEVLMNKLKIKMRDIFPDEF
jgi:transcriptional regulator with XRE-family HTH domain